MVVQYKNIMINIGKPYLVNFKNICLKDTYNKINTDKFIGRCDHQFDHLIVFNTSH